jgi:hypothetical protein
MSVSFALLQIRLNDIITRPIPPLASLWHHPNSDKIETTGHRMTAQRELKPCGVICISITTNE